MTTDQPSAHARHVAATTVPDAPPQQQRVPRRQHAAGSPSLGFRAARKADLAALFAWYQDPGPSPFFTEIAGPTPHFGMPAFQRYCRADAALHVGVDDAGQVRAFLLLTYIQADFRVANLDVGFRDATPAPGSTAAATVATALKLLLHQQGLAKVHLLALRSDKVRVNLALALGFRNEGVLTRHFFHDGKMHDLICLGLAEERLHG